MVRFGSLESIYPARSNRFSTGLVGKTWAMGNVAHTELG
jgi:hypothetical protein